MNIIKFACFLLICLVANLSSGELTTLVSTLFELSLIFLFSLLISSKYKCFGYIFNILLCFLLAFQCVLLYFSGEFLSILMIENVNVIDNLGDNLALYVVSVIGIFVFSLCPFFLGGGKKCKLKILKCISSLLILGYVIYILGVCHAGNRMSSPFFSYLTVSGELIKQCVFSKALTKKDKNRILDYFKRDSVGMGFNKCDIKCSKPNVILIFTEGLSAEVLDVYNDLNLALTPHLDSLHAVSLSFDNYYNHTAATFRGIRGQLYSGFQYRGGYDPSDNLGFGEIGEYDIIKKTRVEIKSLVDILKENGYYSYFVNPEPEDLSVSSYIKTLGFDEVLPVEGNRKLTDKESFDQLKNIIQVATSPYFIGFYNIGTHHGFDSPDEKYMDGKNPVLNRYYNYDAQFGKWFNQMKSEGIFENTLLIFTTDHASYKSPEWAKSFTSSQQHPFISRIPLFLYGIGLMPGRIDANGRNSLDLTPTILDVLNMGNCTNWFLGNSLFCQSMNQYDYFSALGNEFFCTESNRVEYVSPISNKVISDIKNYYFISVNECLFAPE